MEDEDPRVEDSVDVEESNNEVEFTTVEVSPSSKPKSEMKVTMEISQTTNDDIDLIDAQTVSSAQSDKKNVIVKESNNGTETTAIELPSPTSKSKSKGTKKKKKKISRNNDSNSPEFLSVFNEQSGHKSVNIDESSNGIEATTVLSTSSKPKSKRKKKKKTNTNDDGESFDIVSVSSAKSGHTASKSSPRKKKKKKIKRETEALDVTPECSTRSDDGTEDEKSLMTNSVKSAYKVTPKSSKSKSKKKKVKSLNENKSTIPDIERSKSSEPGQPINVGMKRTKSLNPVKAINLNEKRTKNSEPDQPSGLLVKRSMSLDLRNNQFRSPASSPSGRLNSERDNSLNVNNGRGRAHGGRGRGSPIAGRGRGRGKGPPSGGRGASRPQRPPERMQNGERIMEGRGYSQERIPYGDRGISQERAPYGARGASQERSSYGGRSLSQDRSPYDSRGASQERSPYGGTRVANGRGLPPSPRGRRRMSFPQPSTSDENPQFSRSSRGNPPLQSKPSRGNIYRAPSRPKSILRNSSHHGMLGSSHHRNDRSIATTSSHSSSQYYRRRVSMDLNAGSRHSYNKHDPHSSFGSEIDSSDVESDDDDSSFAMEHNDRPSDLEDSGKKYQKHVPKTVVRGYSRTLSGLGTNSSHHYLKSTGQSSRSLLTIENSEFHDDNMFIRMLRYIRILSPHPNEDPIKKKIRIVTWIALICDFLNSVVAIFTYGGETTKCCGKSIMYAVNSSVDSTYNWDLTIFIVTIMYMALIFMEVLPVMRESFPFNLLNPFIGFLITFAVFFSDSIVEAVIMWCFEAMAVGCEVANYRLRIVRFGLRKARLKNTKKEIEKLRKIKRKVKNQFDSGGGRILARADSEKFVLDLNDSSSFAEDSSFFDDVETQHNSMDANTVASRTARTTVSNIGTARETRLLRDRRQLIRSQSEDERELRIHFFGMMFNVFLVFFSLLMIVIIAKNKGMCIVGMKFGNPFKNHIQKCNDVVGGIDQTTFKCNNGDSFCEICGVPDQLDQCYYPYGF